jgi:hypothetical protein
MEILSISPQVAFAAAVISSLVAIAILGLRRASRKVNEILHCELSPEIGYDRHTRHSRVENSLTPQRNSLLADPKQNRHLTRTGQTSQPMTTRTHVHGVNSHE